MKILFDNSNIYMAIVFHRSFSYLNQLIHTNGEEMRQKHIAQKNITGGATGGFFL